MTLQEIEQKKFAVVLRGYKTEEVNAFLDEICTYINGLQEEKLSMLQKMELLAQKVERYKEEEQDIRDTLLNAKKIERSVVQDATQSAETMLQEAKEKAEALLAQSEEEAQTMLQEAAQKAKELLEQSQQKAERIDKQTAERERQVIQGFQLEAKKERLKLQKMQEEVAAFKASLLDLYRSHIKIIQRLPDYEEAKTEEKTSKEEPNPEQASQDTPQEVMTESVGQESPQEGTTAQEATAEVETQVQETQEYDKEAIKQTVNPLYRPSSAPESQEAE